MDFVIAALLAGGLAYFMRFIRDRLRPAALIVVAAAVFCGGFATLVALEPSDRTMLGTTVGPLVGIILFWIANEKSKERKG